MLQRRLAALVLVAMLAAGVLSPDAGPEAGWTTLGAAVQAPTAEAWTPEAWAGHHASSDDAPTPGVQTGIGPGSAMRQGVGSQPSFICTAAFLLRDPYTGTYYLSTAGHCLVREETDPAPYTGAANPDKVDSLIQVCVAGCLDNALGIGTYVDIKAKEGFHPVAFAQSGGVGLDFGIVQLPADLHDELRPDLPMWGGPTGLASASDGADSVVFYGHGSYCCPGVGAVASRTPADQGRAGVYQGAGASSWEALGWSSPGDSGSGVSLGVAGGGDGLAGGKALGVLTHGTYLVNPAASVPIFTGTMLSKGLEMVRAATGLQLELVLAGDPLPQAPTATQDLFNVTVSSPPDGSTLSLAAKKVAVTGTAGKEGGALPEGMAVQLSVDDPGFGNESRIPVAGNASWKANWDLAGVRSGPHVLRARLVDGQGVVHDQTNVSVTLSTGPASTGNVVPGGHAGSATSPSTDTGSRPAEGEPGQPTHGVGAPAPSWMLAVAAVAAVAAALRRRG